MTRATMFVLIAMTSTVTLGATKTVRVGKDTYGLHTNSSQGACREHENRDGSRDIICSDGGSSAALNTTLGCLDSTGAGYCGKNTPHREGLSGAQLNCPLGESYFLFSGRLSDNNCRLEKGAMSCRTSEGTGYAEATCTDGCGNTATAGMCCQVGPECPPRAAGGDPRS